MKDNKLNDFREPPVWLAALPVAALIAAMTILVITQGAFAVQEEGQWLLLAAGVFTALLAIFFLRCHPKRLVDGLRISAKQILPSIPILVLIGAVSATWMLSGVVPMLIDYGLQVISPDLFLVIACGVCALVSVITGSSWTTIATIGVAFLGIGTVMGYSPGWIAGAIISGAYFGDKISPLSDTTVLASASCGVNLFSHIRNMMSTSIPSMVIAMGVFAAAGFLTGHSEVIGESELQADLATRFNLTPWLMVVPVLTALLIALRLNSYLTLGVSSLLGLAAMFVFQPGVVTELAGDAGVIGVAAKALLTSTQLSTGSELLDSLVGTGGVEGMLPTVYLVSCAAVFGGMMIGSGMLSAITGALHRRIHSRRASVSATVVTGITMNSSTGDQFLSIILTSNIYKSMYEHNGQSPLLLSRTVEDSVSVTSVLIPWNSCGLTQSAVLGVSTLTYLPYCVFNIVSPMMSLLVAWAGYHLRRPVAALFHR